MKNILLIFFALLNLNIYGQEILLKGIVKDTTNGRSKINIQVIGKNKKWLSANRDGSFEVKAFPNDKITFSSQRHLTQKIKVTKLIKLDSILINLEPGGCVELIPCKEEPKLYVFIGKKIKIKNVAHTNYCDYLSMDTKYEATYKIIENIYGDYPNKKIKFISYEHGIRSENFYDFKYVLIYVADYCGVLTHVKYQYDPLYKTEDNKWASPYIYFNDKNYVHKNIFPEKIEFKNNLIFHISKHNRRPELEYPKPYYEIIKDKAIPKYGNFPKELFEIKKSILTEQFNIIIK